MLAKPDSRALRALYSFSNHAGWDEVSKMLEAELASTYEMLVKHKDEVIVRQMQGRAQFILEFQKLVREARQELEMRQQSTL